MRSAFSSFEVDFDLFDLAVEAERPPIEIVERHRRAEIDADIEGLARGEGRRARCALTVVRATSCPSTFNTTSAGDNGLGLASWS